MMSNLSKFARLAWTITRSKQNNASASASNASASGPGTRPEISAANHMTSSAPNHNIPPPQLMNHRTIGKRLSDFSIKKIRIPENGFPDSGFSNPE